MQISVVIQRLLLCGVVLSTQAEALPLRSAAGQREPLPEVAPIPQSEKAFTENDFRREERAWAERCLIMPAKAAWQSQPWAGKASALVSEAFDMIEKEHIMPFPLTPLAGRFRELLKEAANEPLIVVLGTMAAYGEKQNWRETKVLENLSGMKGALALMAADYQLRAAERKGKDEFLSMERSLEALSRAMTDGSYDEASQEVLLRHGVKALHATDFKRPEALESLLADLEGGSLPEWSKLTLIGVVQTELAWVKRSSDSVADVSEKQWTGFADHLKLARDALGKAARLRPDRPEAASGMIVVAMGESVDDAELRSWFDRAVSAQFDYAHAYKSLLWAYRPRWLGSYELMMAFGIACKNTGRYETLVPSRLMQAVVDISTEVYAPQKIFRHPDVQQEIITMAKAMHEQADSAPPQTRHMRHSNAAMCAYLADDDALAAKALTAVGPTLHPVTKAMLNEMLLHEAMLRADVASDTGVYGEAIRKAVNPVPGTPLEKIHEELEKIDEKGLSDDALAFLREARGLTGLSKSLEGGDWVKLNFYKHLSGYFQTEGGDWSVESDGTLIHHGMDDMRARLMMRVQLGGDIEIKGEMRFDVPAGVEESEYGAGSGPVLHWMPDGCSGLRVMMFHLDSQRACTKAWCQSMSNSTRDTHFKQKEWNNFSVRSAAGLVSYDVNDRSMARRHSLEKLGVAESGGMIGFGGYHLPIGGRALFRNVSIRKITEKDLDSKVVPAAAKKPPVSGAASPAAPTASSDNKLWMWILVGVLAVLALLLPKFLPSRDE